MNMFGKRSEPSAEVLAGSGPTTTYPAPPGDSATPQAIASVAGGTAGSNEPITAPAGVNAGPQIASLGVRPGYVRPASSRSTDQPTTNLAAAHANGIFNPSSSGGPSAGKMASTNSSSGVSGYQFGNKSPDESAGTMPGGVGSPSPSAYAMPSMDASKTASDSITPSSYAPPTDLEAPSASAAAPKVASSTPDKSATEKGDNTVGFTLPGNMAADITPPKSDVALPTMPDPTSPEPSFSTASSTSGYPGVTTSAIESAPSTSDGGYSPGSTAGATGYPTGDYGTQGNKDGSFYR